jgi:agmatine/peptidylarginine deiminase
MGWHGDGRFRSYANALLVDDAVLVPIYPEHPEGQREALAAFARALPDREVIPVVASDIIARGGAIRCTALTVHR